MPVVVVASFTAKPESVDAVRASCKKAIEAVHDEPGCQLSESTRPSMPPSAAT